jgi:hypothetical protein
MTHPHFIRHMTEAIKYLGEISSGTRVDVTAGGTGLL